jgi:hypothetical protein
MHEAWCVVCVILALREMVLKVHDTSVETSWLEVAEPKKREVALVRD